VAYIGHSAAMSGAEIALLRLLKAQPNKRATVILAEDGPLVTRLYDAGADLIVMPLSSTAGIPRSAVSLRRLPIAAVASAAAYAVRLAWLLRRIRTDVVHTNSMKAHFYGGVAAKLAGLPHVWHARDRAADDYLPRAAVHLVRAAARTLPTVVIANSGATLATYPGVHTSIVVHDAAPTHVRRSPAPEGPLRFGVVGRLAPWKGQDLFLDAFATAFGDGEQQAVLVGDALFGEQRYADQLRRRADDLGIADRVEFAGHTDDVPARLDDLHVLVHCSTTPEPFGQVVVEGMAAGLPVIASAAGGPCEIINDQRNGLLVAPGDVAQLSAALTRLDRDAALRARIGAAAEAASTRFRPDRVATRISAIHRQVMERPKEPA
jgi:glycosyltransferase involved in cell wall biosynthesis